MATRVRTSTRVNIANFDKRMQTLGQRVYQRSNEGVKDVSKETVNALFDRTPKDTNQAAANWQVTVGAGLPSFKPGHTDISAARSAAHTAIDSREAGAVVNITNATPYIGKLNDGHSKQAPANFIEAALSLAYDKVRSISLLKGR